MEPHLRVDGRGDRTRQVYQQVRAAIADGLLRPGEAVPSSRELARRLGVARNTVTLAYDRLTRRACGGWAPAWSDARMLRWDLPALG